MKITETFIVEYQKRDSWGSLYEELVKLHHCINQDGSSNKYFIEYSNGVIQKIDNKTMFELLKNY